MKCVKCGSLNVIKHFKDITNPTEDENIVIRG